MGVVPLSLFRMTLTRLSNRQGATPPGGCWNIVRVDGLGRSPCAHLSFEPARRIAAAPEHWQWQRSRPSRFSLSRWQANCRVVDRLLVFSSVCSLIGRFRLPVLI